jgi:hypothetical protein
MYIRNMKQLLRQTEPGFDEHRYGFSNLVDLLRALQRDGMLRLERDRQGALRVFQGPGWTQAAQLAAVPQVEAEPEPAVTVEAPVPNDAIVEASSPEIPVLPLDASSVEVPTQPSQPQQERRRRTRKPKAATEARPAEKAEPAKARKTGRTKAAKTATPKTPRRRATKAAPEASTE